MNTEVGEKHHEPISFSPLPHCFGYRLPFPDTFLKLCNVSKETPLWKKMKIMLARICWLFMLARHEIHEDYSQSLLIIQINMNGLLLSVLVHLSSNMSYFKKWTFISMICKGEIFMKFKIWYIYPHRK